ncbi:conserved hypothetical protein [Burkholderia pseudomallei 668]|nr:conserved hypothetical protein [Burkholderia pseudomallei 668]
MAMVSLELGFARQARVRASGVFLSGHRQAALRSLLRGRGRRGSTHVAC